MAAAVNALVTGGAGFVGSHLTDRLIAMGYRVRALDNLDAQVHGTEKAVPAYFNKDAELLVGDVRSGEDVRKAVQGMDVVFHGASVVGVGQSMYEIHRYMDVNVLGTANLLQVLADGKHGVRKLVVASSMSIYGEGEYSCKTCGRVYPALRPASQLEGKDWEMKCPVCGGATTPIGTTEQKPLQPTSVYAVSKRDQEELCLSVGRAYGIPTVALRFFNIYGSRQALSNPYTGVAAIFSCRVLNGSPPVVYENGGQSRDFIHVSDIVRAIILAIEKDEANYEVFNVGTGRSLSVLDVARHLIKAHGSDIEPRVVNKFRHGDTRHCYADITKIKCKLGFKPAVSFEDGARELVEWARGQESTDGFDSSRKELEGRRLIL